jgi:hypothetical protein
MPVRPLSVTFRTPIVPRRQKLITALLWGDTHFPHQDDPTIAVIFSILKRLQPTVMVHMGDICDAYWISRFDKDPNRKDTLQDEIDMARQHLAQARKLSPNSRFVLLEGNHEDRLRRALWNMEGPAAQLAKLTAFKKALTWPALLGLDAMHIEFIPYAEQTKHMLLPRFLVKHGTVVRANSCYTANGEFSKYGKSGASGHTHRLGAFYRKDLNGSHVWVETGCTCSLDAEYTQDPNWQNGCVVLTFEPATGAVQVEPVYIANGMTVFRGEVYHA